jgi:hypothetical protein
MSKAETAMPGGAQTHASAAVAKPVLQASPFATGTPAQHISHWSKPAEGQLPRPDGEHERANAGGRVAARSSLAGGEPAPIQRMPSYTLPDFASVGIQQSTRSILPMGPAQSPAERVQGETAALPPTTRRHMENAFRHGFSGVRVHPDSPRATGNVQAITEGRDIHFARARYQPGTAHGDWLIGHELAHVVQQSGRALGPQAFRPDLVQGRAPDETLTREIEADRAATDAVAGRPVRIELAAAPGRPQAFAGETADPAALEIEPEVAAPTKSPEQPAKSESKPDEESKKESNEESDEASKEESTGEPEEPAEADPGKLETSEPPVTEDELGVDAGARLAPPVLASAPTAPGQTGDGGGGGKTAGGGNVELLIPEAPSELSPAAKARLANVTAQVAAAGKTTTALPTAQKTTEDAHKAVTEPREQQKARAEASAVQQVDDRPAPSASVEAACTRIREIIKSKRPPDEKSLVEAKPKEMAKQAGGQVQSDVQSRAGSVSGGYEAIDNPPKGKASQTPVPAVNPPAQVATPAIDAHTAAPDPLTRENVSLDADAAKQKQSMDGAGMNSEPAKLVKSGPIADARAAAGELDAAAKSRPAEILAQQAAAIDGAKSDMRALRDKASAALSASRAGTVNQLVSTRVDTTASEEKQRAQAGRAMQAIFARAQSQVDGLLEPISQMAIKRWDAGVQQLSTRFEAVLADTKQKVEARYNGKGNFGERLVGEAIRLKDTWIGLPNWAVEAYDRAEGEFAAGCCDLARDISRDVNDIVAKCEKIVEQARADIDKYVKSLPRKLRDWASGQAEKIGLQLDDLQKRVVATQEGLNQDLVNRTNQAVQEVRERVHTLREEAKGFVGRIQDAIAQFLEDPARFIIDGLLQLVGIAPARFWALIDKIGQVADGIAKDPMSFANNLMKGIGDGFTQFFNRFPEHLLQGILDWLFSKLGEAGVQMPKDFSLPSIVTLFLQVLGITWERVRKLIAKHIGEDNVALIEQAYSMVAELMAKGPEGIFALMEEQLAQMFDPKMILDTMIAAVKDYLMQALITQVTPKIIAMLNPAGAILKAIEAIYRVIDWIFTHAARLFSLVEAVVNGAADILAGNTAGMANAVEAALAGLIGPVIGFLADFIGLSGIPEAVKDAVLGLQQRVENVLDKVIGFLTEKARALLARMGISGQREQSADGKDQGANGAASDLIVQFHADEERHRLWVTEAGRQPRIMVASTPMTVDQRIGDWESRRDELSKDPVDKPGLATRLIAQARQELQQLITMAQALPEDQRADPGARDAGALARSQDSKPPARIINQVKAEEQGLAAILKQLFELYGDIALPAELDRRYQMAFTHPSFQASFTVSVWQQHFSLGLSQAQDDLQSLKSQGRVVPQPERGRYALGPLSEQEVITRTREAVMAHGRTSAQIGAPAGQNRSFSTGEVRAFCVEASVVPENTLTPKVMAELMRVLLSRNEIKETSPGTGTYTWAPMPPQRFLPDHWDGEYVRRIYYINDSGYDSMNERVRRQDMADIQQAITMHETTNMAQHRYLWANLKRLGIVADDIYDPAKKAAYLDRSQYDVDHLLPLAKHWCIGGAGTSAGNDTDEATRHRIAGSETNLRMVPKSENRSKSAEGYGYKQRWWVGPDFRGPGSSKGYEWANEQTKFKNFV